jgi:dTMP kinase
MFGKKKDQKFEANIERLAVARRFDKRHPYKGKLIVVEGIDGSGKSTQLALLQKWLESKGYGTQFTEWNSSKLISQVIKKGKKKGRLNAATFSLLHATDFADRLQEIIVPALKSGMVVLADRYIYTALSRDVARDCRREWVRNTYSFAVKPDAVFYFKVPVKVSLERITHTREPKYYEAGMDMKLSADLRESYLLFQSRVLDEYDSMTEEYGFHVIDAVNSVHEKQMKFREMVMSILRDNDGKT